MKPDLITAQVAASSLAGLAAELGQDLAHAEHSKGPADADVDLTQAARRIETMRAKLIVIEEAVHWHGRREAA